MMLPIPMCQGSDYNYYISLFCSGQAACRILTYIFLLTIRYRSVFQEEADSFFGKLEGIFAKDDFTKAQVVEALRVFLPNFQHEETGKNLDQKM